MIKKIKIISIVVFSILLVSCGFKIINQTQSLIYIQNINVTGDRQAGSIIKNNISLISNEEAEDKYTIDLKANKKTSTKIKNEKGKTTRYELIIMADLVLTTNKLLSKKRFQRVWIMKLLNYILIQLLTKKKLLRLPLRKYQNK